MKQLTRQEVEAVVDRLADKTLKKGCVFTWNHDWWTVNFIDLSDRIFAFSLSGDMHDLACVNQERRWEYKYHMFTQDSDDWSYVEVLGNPITIGAVLSKIDKKVGGRNYHIGQTTYNDELIHLWSRCGELTQSLQEIIDKSGYDKKLNQFADFHTKITTTETLTSPEANALFSFLQEIL